MKIYKWFWTYGSRNPIHKNCADRNPHEPHNYLLRAFTSPGNADYAVCDGNQQGAKIIPHGFGKAVAVGFNGFNSAVEAEILLRTEIVQERKARLEEVLRKYPGTKAEDEKGDLVRAEEKLASVLAKDRKDR